MKLRKPTLGDEFALQELVSEGRAYGNIDDCGGFPCEDLLFRDYEEWLEKMKEISSGKIYSIPKQEIFLSFKGGELIGFVVFSTDKHVLNDLYWGAVGYYIKPDRRERGYGKKQMHLAKIEMKKLGIERITVTANEHNRHSRKIIERLGGVRFDDDHTSVTVYHMPI